jgi:hypothetical protein
MRIMLVTDAWEPQVNGVVRTLSRTVQELRAMGHVVLQNSAIANLSRNQNGLVC